MVEVAAIIALLKSGYEGASKAGVVIKSRSGYAKIKKAITLLEKSESNIDAASELLDEAAFQLNPQPPKLKKAIRLLAERRGESWLEHATRELLARAPDLYLVRRLVQDATEALPPSHPDLRHVRAMLERATEHEQIQRLRARRLAKKAGRKGGRKRTARRGSGGRKAASRKGGRKAAKRSASKKTASRKSGRKSAKR